MQSEYVIINVQNSAFAALDGNNPCRSHTEIPAEHLFANPNWVKMETDDKSIVSFQCQQCLQIRTYKRLKEKVLL